MSQEPVAMDSVPPQEPSDSKGNKLMKGTTKDSPQDDPGARIPCCVHFDEKRPGSRGRWWGRVCGAAPSPPHLTPVCHSCALQVRTRLQWCRRYLERGCSVEISETNTRVPWVNPAKAQRPATDGSLISLRCSAGVGLCGVGIYFEKLDTDIAKPQIKEITARGSAERDGNLEKGDLISHIEGVSCAGWTLVQLRHAILGIAGSIVRLTLNKANGKPSTPNPKF